MSRCIIFANGILPNPDSARRLIHTDDLILAADGGTRHARALEMIPSVVIGDLDSLTPADRAALESAGAIILQHPRDKNETDLELALNNAIEMGHREIVIMAALGNRLDQTLGNLALLTNIQLSTLNIKLDDGVEETFFCRDQAYVEGRRGDLISLIPWGGEVCGVRTEGLRWPLSNETLLPYKTRGISNEMAGDLARIQITSGLVLIIHRRLITEN
jgi:thiamine pyrophosphokinase